jgi:NADPH-dependent 2,4-dienoyl-CoA reductase/sulfur reductase-like enzyme
LTKCPGGAGVSCAETLRQNGFAGRVLLISQEEHLPYDRPKLSKVMDGDAEKLYVRPKSYYDTHRIEVMNNSKVWMFCCCVSFNDITNTWNSCR